MKLFSLIAATMMCLLLSNTVMAEEINLVGTENGEPIFKAIGIAFEKQHPEISVKIPDSIDSGGGIRAVAEDRAVIARVARDFNEREKKYGLTYIPFAKVQIVFFVNTGVEVKNLSVQQINDIYSGKIRNWQDLGGKNLKLRVVTREEEDSATETLEDCLPGFEEIDILSRSKTVFSDSDALDVVQKKQGAIGFGTYGIATHADVRILNIDGKSPADPDYLCSHPVGLVFKDKNKTGFIQKFVEFATSEAAHDVIRNAGGTPF
ncbi:substrate-binding domain-containing protein [Desulfonema magnum]|uniref:Periplasmic binding domain-containing protein n=1 Tax=Desulfonema magnum TaxID=45655 RepID=A0A975GL20_9BACT|nr:substrate-binding domain-containing protein [Desulfonema magnum]QTA85110.1 Periplasmic binding domain-containing protein [Desulfonema magnum]